MPNQLGLALALGTAVCLAACNRGEQPTAAPQPQVTTQSTYLGWMSAFIGITSSGRWRPGVPSRRRVMATMRSAPAGFRI